MVYVWPFWTVRDDVVIATRGRRRAAYGDIVVGLSRGVVSAVVVGGGDSVSDTGRHLVAECGYVVEIGSRFVSEV